MATSEARSAKSPSSHDSENLDSRRTTDLVRMVPLAEDSLRMHDDAEGGEGEGNTLILEPIVFDRWAEVDSIWEGHFMERIARGSVTKTLAERGDRIVVLFNHGLDPSIGNKPLGKPSLQEVRGDRFYAEVPLSDTSYNQDLKALLRDGALDGASFRFDALKIEEDQTPGVSAHNPKGIPERTVTELRLIEYGPVTLGVYAAASSGIRSAEDLARFQTDRSEAQLLAERSDDESAAAADHGTDDESTVKPLSHSTAAQRSHLLRRINEALNDERNAL